MAAPVLVETDIGYAGNTHEPFRGHKAEELAPHRCQIDQMARLPQILLGDL